MASIPAASTPRRLVGMRWAGRLASAEPGQTVEWVAAGLAAPVWAGDGVDAELRGRLLEAQNDDGGWPWASGEPSNAFSTGQALYALVLAGDGQSESTDRARAWLIEQQEPDGTWIVPSSAISSEGNQERDVIYRYWGTAWAVIGLARSSPG